MARGYLIVLASTAALLTTPPPAFASAQDRPGVDAEGRRVQDILRRERQLRVQLRRVEERRLVGDCTSVNDAYFYYVRQRLGMEGFSEELVADLQQQMREIAARPCPPSSNRPFIPLSDPPPAPQVPTTPTPAPPVSGPGVAADPPAAVGSSGGQGMPAPPAPVPDDSESILDEAADEINSTTPDRTSSPAPSPDTSDPSFIRGQMSVAMQTCNRERFEELKRRLIARLDQLVGEAADEFTRGRLQRERELAQAMSMPVPCPPVSPATAPGSSLVPGSPAGTVGTTGSAGSPTPTPVPTTPQIGSLDTFRYEGDWSPVRDIRFRGNYNRAVRAPNVVELFAGPRQVEIPVTGSGVTRAGAPGASPEVDAGLSDNRFNTLEFGGAFYIRNFRLRGSYLTGDGESAFSILPISGGFNGAVFGARSPAGNSGIGAGSATLNGTTGVDLSRFRLGGDLSVAQPSPATRIYFSFDYFREVRTYSSSLTGTVGSGSSVIQFTQQRDQRIRDNAFGVGVGAETRLPLNTPVDGGAEVSLRLTVAAQAYLLDSDLRSIERNVSNFGPASDRDFTIDIDEGGTGLGVAGEAGAELSYSPSPGVAFFVGGSAAYRSRVGALFNPNSGDQVFFEGRTTELTRGDFWSYGARIGIRVAVGRR